MVYFAIYPTIVITTIYISAKMPQMLKSAEIPTRPFGRTGERVSVLGLGGWHVGLPRTDRAAVRLIHAAIDSGITFLDNAWDYNDGLSETRMGQAIADEIRVEVGK